MAFTRFATSEPFDSASGERLNKLGDELQEQINVLSEASYGSTLKTISNIDLNDFLTDGEYWVNGDTCANIPPGKEYGKIKVKKLSTNFAWHEYITASNISFRRTKNGGAWQPWQQLATTTQIQAMIDANNA